MGDAGFGTNRVPVNWAAVQTPRGTAPTTGASPIAASTTRLKNGMRPALVVYGTPGVRAQADR